MSSLYRVLISIVVLSIITVAAPVFAVSTEQPPPVPSLVVWGCVNVTGPSGITADAPIGLPVSVVLFYDNGSVAGVYNTTIKYLEDYDCNGYDAVFQVDYDNPPSYVRLYMFGVVIGESELLQSEIVVQRVDGLYYDDEPPTAIENLSMVSDGASPSFEWSPASDNIAVKGYQVALYASNGSLVLSEFVNSTNYTVPIVLGENRYSFVVYAVDIVNNNGSAASLEFLVDTAPPVIYVYEPANGSWYAGSVPVRFAVCDYGIGVSGYEVALDDTVLSVPAAQVNDTCVVVESSIEVDDGVHSLTISAFDKYNHSSTVVVVFGVDSVAPVINVVEPVNGSITSDMSPVFKLLAIDQGSGVNASSLVVSVDGVVLGNYSVNIVEVNDSAVEFYVEISLTGGWHSVGFSVSDMAGNTGAASITIAVDVEAPSIVSVFPEPGSLLGASTACTRIGASVTDDVMVANASIYVDGENVATTVIGASSGVVEASYCFNSSGEHGISVVVFDAVGRNVSESWSVYVDLVNPVVEIIKPVNGSLLADSVINVTAFVSDDYQIANIPAEVYVDGRKITASTSKVNDTFAYIYAYAEVVDGWHTIKVVGFDAAGNSGSDSVSVAVDTTPPLIDVLSPINNSLVNSTTVSFRAVVSDNVAGINNVSVYLDDNPVNVTVQGLDGSVELSGTFDVSEGGHVIKVAACDNAGNCGEVTVSFVVDTTAPRITVVSPANLTEYNVSRIPVYAYACDDNGIMEFVAVLENYSVAVNGVPYNSTCMLINTSLLLDMGAYRLEFVASDKAGNIAKALVLFNVTADLLPPVIADYEPKGAVASKTLQLSVTACDYGSGVDVNATLFVLDNSIVPVDSYSSINDSCVVIRSATVEVEEGIHSASATVFDRYGNNASVNWNIVVDVTAPIIVVVSPVNNTWYSQQNVLVQVLVNDVYSGVENINVVLDDAMVDISVIAINDTAILINDTIVVDNGMHLLEVEALDAAGNSAKVATVFGVDTVPPLVSIVEPRNDSILNVSTVTVKAIVNENISAISYYKVYLDGMVVNATLEDNSITARIENISDGSHIINVTVVDLAGNMGVDTAVFTIDTRPPVIVFNIANGTMFVSNTICINGTIIDEHLGESMPTINDSRFTLAYWNKSSGYFEFCNVTSLEPGEYAITVSYVDAAGNAGKSVLVFKIAELAEIEIMLKPGWNLVGISLEPLEPQIESVFNVEDIDVIYWYYNGSWHVWSPLYRSLKEVHAGMGLWVHYIGNTSIVVKLRGIVVDEPQFNYIPGQWNLIAPLYKRDPTVPSEFADRYGFSELYHWDKDTGWQVWVRGLGGNMREIVPGYGYWAK